LVGKPKDPTDPRVFHHITLIAFLAWVGLGADGLSSSAYGPEEAFKALGQHAYLAVFISLMIAGTVLVISACYSKVIELFPGGGGGYLVATKLLGPRVGVVSGCALIIDYVLTISVSVASGIDQIFSFLPDRWHGHRFLFKLVLLGILILLNLRGVKESVQILAPIFLVFLGTHALMIIVALIQHFVELPGVYGGAIQDARATASTIGLVPTLFIVLRAYSLGGGAYTGIEAVSNGMAIIREPKVANAKRTMAYMAASLAFTAGGVMLGYLLTGSRAHPTKVMNAVFAEKVFGPWNLGGIAIGQILIIVTLLSAGAILFVAAQTGFLGGPRILANMAVDSWVPRRFAQLSDRLVNHNGIWMMGLAAAATLFYSRGNVSSLIVMYSINVFVTFTLTMLGMARHWLGQRGRDPKWTTNFLLQAFGVLLCAAILVITVYEKLEEGGWVTVVVTSSIVAVAFAIRAHYTRVREQLRRLDDTLLNIPVREHKQEPGEMKREEPVAVMLVSGFSGLGIHTVLSVQSLFPHQYKSYLFASCAVIDSATFKGTAEVEGLKRQTVEDLEKYVAFVRQLGFKADYRYTVGTEAVEHAVALCERVRQEFPRSIFFLGQLVFENDKFYYRILHNETAFAIQRRLQFAGLQAVVLPIRVLAQKKAS
jgi:amino acid transporter